MGDVLLDLYPWTKALHVISVIAWMAGLLYLPRLFVYHAGPEGKPAETSATFKVMEYRLLRYIMNPAMIATWVFGLMLAFTPGIAGIPGNYWFYPKFAAILGLTWVHHWLAKRRKDFAADQNPHPPRMYRIMNEAPTVLMIVIVIMVIVKPF